MSIEAMKLALSALENNRQTHHYCEDTWYSCPKHEEGCANDAEGNECNCGADRANEEIDAAIVVLRQAIAEAENQEPVCDKDPQGCWNVRCQLGKVCKNAHPQPKQEPVAMRYDFDGYGYKYIDNGSGSDWQTRIKDAEPVFAHPQPKQGFVE